MKLSFRKVLVHFLPLAMASSCDHNYSAEEDWATHKDLFENHPLLPSPPDDVGPYKGDIENIELKFTWGSAGVAGLKIGAQDGNTWNAEFQVGSSEKLTAEYISETYDGKKEYKLYATIGGQNCPLYWRGDGGNTKNAEFRCGESGDLFWFEADKIGFRHSNDVHCMLYWAGGSLNAEFRCRDPGDTFSITAGRKWNPIVRYSGYLAGADCSRDPTSFETESDLGWGPWEDPYNGNVPFVFGWIPGFQQYMSFRERTCSVTRGVESCGSSGSEKCCEGPDTMWYIFNKNDGQHSAPF